MAYSTADSEKLFRLLPAHIRERDEAEGGPLKALLHLIEQQADAIDDDIRQLQQNAFVETAEPWAIPYIGDLVGTTPLFDESHVVDYGTAMALFEDLEGPELRAPIAIRGRADVAKTIYYRRRKGTLPMLEELARDVTGWPTHAVEYFELLGWTQWVRNHLRPHSARTPDVRSVERMDRLDGAFDDVAHTVDVRPISQHDGWHNIRNIGFFLWRLGSYRMEAVTARRLGAAGDHRYYFSPLGTSAPLIGRTRREGNEAGLATELHVPTPIRPAKFFEDLQAYAALPLPRPGFTEFYGLFNAFPGFNLAPAPSLMVFVDGTPIPADAVRCRNLSTWSQPADDHIAIDVALGRLSLGPDLVPAEDVEVYYHYGFPAELGGGPYRRRAWLARRSLADDVFTVDGSGDPGTFGTINAALAQWIANGRRAAIVRIRDNRTYEESISVNIQTAGGRFLSIEAADGTRPHLRLEAPLAIAGDNDDFTFTLGGLLVEGRVVVTGSLGHLRIIHTTLVPGVSIAEPDPDQPPPPATPVEPSISAASDDAGTPINTELRVELAFSICGPVRLPDHAEGLFALDCVVDGVGEPAIAGIGAADTPGPALHLERSTIRGAVRARQIDFASEVIFDGLATAERTQVGCIRFSYVMPGSTVPRRYRCQPYLAERQAIEEEEARIGPLSDAAKNALRQRIRRRVRPEYTSEAYGQPAYLQLSLGGPIELATGAEDGSEMGAYCHLKQPQRETNLRMRLGEYLPFGLEYAVIYAT